MQSTNNDNQQYVEIKLLLNNYGPKKKSQISKNYLETNKNKNTMYQILRNAVKAALRGKCIAVDTYIIKNKYLKSVTTLHLKD